jgi:pyruvate dehydrogenase E1 component beta subunit
VVEDNVEPIPFGKAAVRREGTQISIITYGACVPKALKAAEELAAGGIEAEVIDLRTLFPLDYDLIEASVRKTHRALVVTEEPRIGGVGGELVASIQENVFDALEAPVARIGGAYSPIPHSPPLVEQCVPQPGDIARVAAKLVTKSRAH